MGQDQRTYDFNLIMHIALLVDYYDPPLGGGEITFRVLLKSLLVLKIRITIVQNSQNGTNEVIEKDGFHICKLNDVEEKTKIMGQLKPDLIISGGYAVPHAQLLGSILQIPVWCYVQSIDHFCPAPGSMPNCERNCGQCKYYNDKFDFIHMQKEAVAKIDKIFTVSNYLKQQITFFTGRNDIEILRPATELIKYDLNQSGNNKLILSTGSPYKGLHIFLGISQLLPNHKFWIVGNSDPVSYGFDLNQFSNVSYSGWIDNAAMYRDCKYILIPTPGPEGYPRVAPEAMANGIIPIGANFGGTPEAIGNGGVLINNHLDPNEWVKKILELDADENLRNSYKSNMQQEIERVDPAAIIREFQRHIIEFKNN